MILLGKQLLALRLKEGLSQGELAKRSKISQVALCRIERGKIQPKIKTAQRIARAMGYTMKVEVTFARDK